MTAGSLASAARDLSPPPTRRWWLSNGRGNVFGALGLSGFLALTLTTCALTGELNARVGSGICVAVVTVSFCWAVLRRAPNWTLMTWPALLSTSLLCLTVEAPDAAGLLVGIQSVGFLFVGLTRPPLWFAALLPLACTTAWFAFDLPVLATLVRLGVAVLVWVLVAEFPARLLLRATRLAQTDPLTGLANRSSMYAALAELDRAATLAAPTASLVLIDLDHFKIYNDTHGHLAGDELLKSFATCLAGGVRSTDLVYRFGGEEFLLILPGTTSPQASELTSRLRTQWARSCGGKVTFSAGIASALHRADANLYAAKTSGRDRVVADC